MLERVESLPEEKLGTQVTKKNRHAERTGLFLNLHSQAALAQSEQGLSISPRSEISD